MWSFVGQTNLFMKAHDLERQGVGVFLLRMGKTRGLAAVALWALLALAAPVSASEPAGTVGGDTYSVTRYDAFGRVEYEVSPDVPRFGFTGYLRGPESDLFYAEQRWYDARTGRFLSEDPIWGDPQTPLSLHRYLYAYANPTVYVDPDGRWPLARDLMGRKDFAKDLDEAGYGVMASELAQRRSLQLAGMRVRAGQGGVLSIGAAATSLPAARVVGSIGRAVWKAVAATHAEIKAVGLANALLANPHTVTVASGELAVTGAAIASGADTPLGAAAAPARRAFRRVAEAATDPALRTNNALARFVAESNEGIGTNLRSAENGVREALPGRTVYIDSRGTAAIANAELPVNYRGRGVVVPEGHRLGARDPGLAEAPMFERGPFTSTNRDGFLAGNSGGTQHAPHHRHQLPTSYGSVIDELRGPGHPLGNVHTGGAPTRHPNPSVFRRIPDGEQLRRAEIRDHWIEKGERLIEIEPGVWLDPGPGGG